MGSNFGALTRLVQREPVAFQGCVQATLAALAGFGVVHWSTEQVGLALALVAAFLAFFTRAAVTPTAPVAAQPPTIAAPTAPPPRAD